MKKRDQKAALRRAVKSECRRQLETFFGVSDPESGLPMLDVLCAHVAVGYGISVGVQVEHPNAPGQVTEDPSVTQQLAKPKPIIQVVK